MRVTIWDLDYFYNKDTKRVANPDVMKISSYHKQMGDSVNFVETELDIYRPYDLYYIVKEKQKTKNPPFNFFIDNKVRWWGRAYQARINWKMPDGMLICRPDYLLYPNHNTKEERSEYIRLFNDQGDRLPVLQDWTNAFKGAKHLIVSDKNFWAVGKEKICAALDFLSGYENIMFLEPIWIKKIIDDPDIKERFVRLKFSFGANFQWLPIVLKDVKDSYKLMMELKKNHPTISFGIITIKFNYEQHWLDRKYALQDFYDIINCIIISKRSRWKINIKMPENHLETPYFLLFEELSNWSFAAFEISWLEYITKRYTKLVTLEESTYYWNHPERWNELFRDVLRQTYTNREFLLLRWGDRTLSANNIPWKLWEDEFKLGL